MVCLAMLAHSAGTAAQAQAGPVVSEIRFEGLERASESLVSSQIEVQVGRPLSRPAVARDIRRLYELGFFFTVRVNGETVDDRFVVTYVFEEKRLIEEIRINGNDKIRDRAIRGVLKWVEGDSFVEDGYPQERIAIKDLYTSKGFPNATVDIMVEEVGPSRVAITYSIDEGRRARIRSIAFEGNETLTDRQLRKVMETKRARWFLGGRYNEDKFEYDLQQIVDEYGDYGRLEADVEGTTFTFNKKGKKFEILIEVAEGPEYTIETLEVNQNTVFDDDEILNIVVLQAGDVHNRSQLADDAELVRKGYEDSGYVAVNVSPLTTLNRDRATTHVVYQIDEGPLKYIREIKITGNSVTRDEVIRRNLLIGPGDRFDGSAVRGSQQRLDGTDYFDEVRLNLEDVEDDPNATNLLIDVEEGQTGNFNFGAGFNTDEGVSGFGELRLNNFDITNWPGLSGAGQQFRFRTSLGQVRSDFSLSFTDPEILGYPLSFGFDIYNQTYSPRGSGYREDSKGARIRFAKALSPTVSTQLALGSSIVDISDDAFRYNRRLRMLEGGPVTNRISWSIARDTTNHFRDPSDGARHELMFELAGLGGHNDFYKIHHESIWFHAIGEQQNWILSYRTQEDYVNSYSGSTPEVPIQERFFAGGTTTVRGYDSRAIGPRIRENVYWGDKVAIGGEFRLINNVEMKYKIGEILRLYTFVDAGGVWLTYQDFGLSDMRYSVGVGFGIDIPRLGPMRFDYAIPINPDDDQGSGRLHLTSGFRF